MNSGWRLIVSIGSSSRSITNVGAGRTAASNVSLNGRKIDENARHQERKGAPYNSLCVLDLIC